MDENNKNAYIMTGNSRNFPEDAIEKRIVVDGGYVLDKLKTFGIIDEIFYEGENQSKFRRAAK